MAIKYGNEAARLLSHHALFVDIVSHMFPGKNKVADEDVIDVGKAPTVEMAIAQINNVLRW